MKENAVGIQNVVANVGLEMLSCAPDKSRVHSMGLTNLPFALPTNGAFWGPSQERLYSVLVM